MATPPFDMLRAAFLLLAVIMLAEVAETMIAVGACSYLVLSGHAEIGACTQAGIVTQIREVLSEAITGVLALLLAARNQPPPDG